ncbi:MAG: polymer-forming cytoskeletal protein [Syntrophus sp. (in: bacteria)]
MFHRKADKLHLVLGQHSKITGNVELPGAVFVDGMIIGNVDAAKVILGEHSCVSGNIKAGAIIIGGKIDGHLTGTDRVEIKATGHVTGDITTKSLSIAEGGIFNGISRMELDGENTLEKTGSKVVEFLAREQ